MDVVVSDTFLCNRNCVQHGESKGECVLGDKDNACISNTNDVHSEVDDKLHITNNHTENGAPAFGLLAMDDAAKKKNRQSFLGKMSSENHVCNGMHEMDASTLPESITKTTYNFCNGIIGVNDEFSHDRNVSNVENNNVCDVRNDKMQECAKPAHTIVESMVTTSYLRPKRKKDVCEQVEKAPLESEVKRKKLPPVEQPIIWSEGDLVWSLVSGHPLWPCMISKDPEIGSHTKMKGSSLKSSRVYHVQFFGNSPEHAWVGESNIFKFNNKDDYEGLVRNIAKKKLRKPPKIEISKRFILNWSASIEEVITALPLSSKQRLRKFTFKYDCKYPRKVVEQTVAYLKDEPNSKLSENLEGRKSATYVSRKKSQEIMSNKVIRLVNAKASEMKSKSQNESISINNDLSTVVQKRQTKIRDQMFKKQFGSQDKTETSATVEKKKKPYECARCSKFYFSLLEMKEHQKLSHSASKTKISDSMTFLELLPVEESQSSSSSNDVYPCLICSEKFSNRRSLGQHRRFSHPDGIPRELNANVGDDEKIDIDKSCNQTTYTIPHNKPKLFLYSQIRKEPVCFSCEKNGETVSCTSCYRSFHVECLKVQKLSEPFKCKDCEQECHSCILCGDRSDENDGLGDLKRCIVPMCGRYFHSTCSQIFKLKNLSDSSERNSGAGLGIRCPCHSCNTCDSKSIQQASRKGGNVIKNKFQQRSKLLKCIRCATSYHINDDCVAAGTIFLGGIYVVCPKHFNPIKNMPHHQPVHISWCFVCSKGGQLICCASCPAAFHAECIDLESTPDGDFHCLDCSIGVRPLYGDIVWVKLGTYRWWPGEVTHPCEIPDNISRRPHGPGEFVVRFFGSNDYFWLNKHRVFLYQEGDNTATNKHCARGISGVFRRALQEAQKRFSKLTTERQHREEVKTAKNDKKPAPYKHIKTNKPIGKVQIMSADLNDLSKCACKRTDPNACGQESECLNRMLMYECHPDICPAGDRCENQRFQKCQYPDTEVFKTSWGGWGLMTKVYIKKGNFVNEYVGELVDEEECRKRIERSHEENVTNFYMLTIDKDRIIDAGPKGNYSRFMNHSCDPNCETQKWMVNGDTRVGLFALRNITPGEELTFNYNLDCLGNDKTKCMCGAQNCSGFIGERPKPQIQSGMKRDRKKKRKCRRIDEIPQHDDFCFRCRQTGTLVCCDFKGCLRAFCMECLHIEKPPYGKWECPCHHCDWCGRRAQACCSFCPNSFCGSHVQNQLRPSVPNGFDTCLDHNPETAEFEMAKTVATVNEMINSPLYHDETEKKREKDWTNNSNSLDKKNENAENEFVASKVGEKRKRETVMRSGKRSKK